VLAFASVALGPALAAFGAWAFIAELSRAERVALARPRPVTSMRTAARVVRMPVISQVVDRSGRHNSHLHGDYPLHVLGESEFHAELEAIAERCPDRGPLEDSAACQVLADLIPDDDAVGDYRRVRSRSRACSSATSTMGMRMRSPNRIDDSPASPHRNVSRRSSWAAGDGLEMTASMACAWRSS